MRLSVVLLPALLAAGVAGEPLSSRVANLIPADARLIYGIDLARYQQGELNSLYPMTMDGVIESAGSTWGRNVRQLIVAQRDPNRGGGRLIILIGAPATPFSSAEPNLAELVQDGRFALLDAATAVFGDPEIVREAVSHWRGAYAQGSELGEKAKRMSETYDNWFIVARPFESLQDEPRSAGSLKYRSDFAGMVEEVHGGVRVGAINEVRVEVVMKTVEDATALAGLSRWLPGFVQMKAPESSESALADLAENLTVMLSGNTVSVSFTLDESKLNELVRTRRAQRGESEDIER